MSCNARLALECRLFGSLFRTFAVLCTQQRCSRVVGQTSPSAFQRPIAPSATASSGAAAKTTHTSGLTYVFQNRTNVDAAYRAMQIGEIGFAGTLDSMVEQLATVPLEFSPGQAWNYSVSADVLGYLIGKISGKPFEQFLKE